MAARDEHTSATASASAAASPAGNAGRKALLVVLGLVTLFLVWLIGSAVIPRWWAQRMSDLIDGRLTAGSLFGLCIGALFTVLPLLVVTAGWKFRNGLRRLAIFVVIAVLAASPNLFTLGIVLGNGNAAHAGERILDVGGPGFRGGSLLGGVFGIAAFVGVTMLASSRRRNKRKAKHLKAELAGAGE